MDLLYIKDTKGVSLMELMVATLVFSLIAAFGMRFLVLQHRWALLEEDAVEAQQQARTAMDLMGREMELLGFGVPEGEPRLLKTTGQEVEFLANLDGVITHLTEGAQAGQKKLPVEYGKDFKEGKTVSVCRLERCESHALAKDGGTHALELSEGLVEAYPTGSTIQVINRIRYALKPMDSDQFKLVRTIDGGANSVAEGLSSMSLEYLDGEGRLVTALADIHRVRIRLSARMNRTPGKVRPLISEVYLRNG